jgi:quinol-cytochrome oxidoreductase complex cytochrome b subunit
MLVPLLFMFFLLSLVNRTSKKLKVSSTVPMIIAPGLFLIFAILTQGVIRVREDEIIQGILLGILMYTAVAAILYGIAYVWIKKKSLQKEEPSKEKKGDENIK